MCFCHYFSELDLLCDAITSVYVAWNSLYNKGGFHMIANRDPFYQHCLIEIRAWSYPQYTWNVTTHPRCNFNGGFAKPPLKLEHGRIVSCHSFIWMFFFSMPITKFIIRDFFLIYVEFCMWYSPYISVLGVSCDVITEYTGLILGLRPANERRRYFVTTSLIGWV